MTQSALANFLQNAFLETCACEAERAHAEGL